jgi:hypothetical protein
MTEKIGDPVSFIFQSLFDEAQFKGLTTLPFAPYMELENAHVSLQGASDIGCKTAKLDVYY